MRNADILTYDQKEMRTRMSAFRKIGTPGKIRTCDPLIRSQILYPAELRVHTD